MLLRFPPFLLKDKKGMTLLEVVLATVIAGFVLVVLMHCYAVGLKGSIRGRNRIDTQQNARIVLHEITRELRYATAIYDKNKAGKKIELLMPLYEEGGSGGVTRLFLTGGGGQEREIKFNEMKKTVTLRQGSGPDNEIGYNINKLEFYWHIPREMLGKEAAREPKMVFILLEAQDIDTGRNPKSPPYVLHNTVHLKNMEW